MKKIIIIIVALLVALAIATTVFLVVRRNSANNGETDYPVAGISFPTMPEDELWIQVIPETASPARTSFVLRNPTEQTVYLIEQFSLIQLLDDEESSWEQVEFLPNHPEFYSNPLPVSPGETIVITKNWEDFFGELSPGQYNFVQPLTDNNPDSETAPEALNAHFEVVAGQNPDFGFMNFLSVAGTTTNILPAWNATVSGNSISAPILETSEELTPENSTIARTGITGRIDVGKHTVIFNDFDEGIQRLNAAVYIGERRAGYKMDLSTEDGIDFEVSQDEVYEAVIIIVNTRENPNNGAVAVNVVPRVEETEEELNE